MTIDPKLVEQFARESLLLPKSIKLSGDYKTAITSVCELAAAHGAQQAAAMTIDPKSLEPVIQWLENGCNVPDAIAELKALVAQAQQAAVSTTGIPHSLAGFRAYFESEHKRKPTEQEIWNHAIRSWRDLQAAVSEPVTEQAAYNMGAKGAEPTEQERLLFEAWMKGHCWAVIGEWDGTTYVHEYESNGFFYPSAMNTRRLWAAWRDRAALATQPQPQEHQIAPDLTDEEIDAVYAHCHDGKVYPQDMICGPRAMRRVEARAVLAAQRSKEK